MQSKQILSLLVLSLCFAACADKQKAPDKPETHVVATSRLAWDAACEKTVGLRSVARTLSTMEQWSNPQDGVEFGDEITSQLEVSLEDCAARVPEKPHWVLTPGKFETGETVWGLDLDGPWVEAMFWRRGRTTMPANAAPYTSIAFVDGQRTHIVYENLAALIDVVSASPDGRTLAVVRHRADRYAGSGVPAFLIEPIVDLIDLSTLRARSVALPMKIKPSSTEAVVLGWLDGQLYLQRRSGRGGESEAAICNPTTGACIEAAPRGLSHYVEATAGGGYVIEPLPSGFGVSVDMDRRSVRASPDRSKVAWVRERVLDGKTGAIERVLFIRSDGQDTEVARGRSKLHAVWLDDNRLLFEREPVLTPAWTQHYDAVFSRMKETTEGRVFGLSIDAELEALKTLPAETNIKTLQIEGLGVFNTRDRTVSPFLIARHVRLFAQPRRPNIRGSTTGENIEVAPLDPIVLTKPPDQTSPTDLADQCAEAAMEVELMLKSIYVAELSFFAANDKYTSRLREALGRSLPPNSRYRYNIRVTDESFLVVATGIQGVEKGDTWQIDENNELKHTKSSCRTD